MVNSNNAVLQMWQQQQQSIDNSNRVLTITTEQAQFEHGIINSSSKKTYIFIFLVNHLYYPHF